MFERYKRFFKLEEMATIGYVGELKIEIFNDHNPPHFHVTKKDCYEVRISIDTKSIISYKWQKKGRTISSQEYDEVMKWLKSKNIKNKKISNEEAIILTWDFMNE